MYQYSAIMKVLNDTSKTFLVESIRIIYKASDGTAFSGSKHGGDNNGASNKAQCGPFTFNAREKIIQVNGRNDSRIHSLQFVTTENRKVPNPACGGDGGGAFNDSKPGYYLSFISGKSGDVLDQIRFHWAKLPASSSTTLTTSTTPSTATSSSTTTIETTTTATTETISVSTTTTTTTPSITSSSTSSSSSSTTTTTTALSSTSAQKTSPMVTTSSNVNSSSLVFVPKPCINSTFIGLSCNISNSPCEMGTPCENNGICINNKMATYGYICSCLSGFNGTYCELDERICKPHLCLHNGTCNETSNTTFHCVCENGWEGIHCESMVNYCEGVECMNNGVCRPLLLGYKCECLGTSYYGSHCEFTARKVVISKIISKSFSYIAIIALSIVVMFIVIMDILTYCFGIDMTREELERYRREKRDKKRINRRVNKQLICTNIS
ncbi:unnamed protein product [Adineta steineri]|uniref:Uncharacterized protein n=1 Tax=Adineta steineri TaxID=433720 RepID=A0A816D4D0_9BILA|nr:unnamed protein product [Adineta steineri]CAF1630165.1 unnamed protein product [Adineta steineri]